MPQDCFCPGRTFHLLAISIRSVNSAKAALEGAPDTCLVRGRSLAEERRSKVLFDWNPVEWGPWKCIRPFHQALGIVAMQTKDILVRQSGDGLERTPASNGF